MSLRRRVFPPARRAPPVGSPGYTCGRPTLGVLPATKLEAFNKFEVLSADGYDLALTNTLDGKLKMTLV